MVKNVAIFCGGPSSEHEVSISSAKSILKNIDRKKYTPYIFFIQRDLKSAYYKADFDVLPEESYTFDDFTSVLRKNKNNIDIALLSALHGEFGEDGRIQEILEEEKIPYTGSDSESSKLCIDKYLSMQKIKSIKNLYFPKTEKLKVEDLSSENPPFNFPFLVKPNNLGSSVLVHMIKNAKELKRAIKDYKNSQTENILAQEIIDGLEVSCGCLERKDGEFISLPPIEIKPHSSFFDYSAKYDVGGSEEITPPVSISKEESKKISNLSIELHKKLKCSTYTRSDFIYKNGKLYFLETNTLPGFTSTSLLPQEADAKNISFKDLIDFIIKETKI